MSRHVISAEHLQLALIARKVRPQTRWAALSNGASTRRCDTRSGPWHVKHGPLMAPMDRGNITRAVESIRMADGLDGVRRTFGCGIKALRVELASAVMHAGAAA